MKKFKPTYGLFAFMVFLTVVLSGMIPVDTAYAATKTQNTNVTQENVTEESTAQENLCGCVLDDGLTVFDAWEQSVPKAAMDAEAGGAAPAKWQ